MNLEESNTQGKLSIMFGKTQSGPTSSFWDLAIGQYDDQLRIEIAGEWIDVSMPGVWNITESS